MEIFLVLTAIVLKLSAYFVSLSEGITLHVSQEFTVYAGQNLTLLCQPRDCPPDLVYWYRIDKDNRDQELYHSTGRTHTITNATIDDIGVYSCIATEWGLWGIRNYIFVNVVVPGETSCADGWNLHRNSNACYLYSARGMIRSWKDAKANCKESNAQLAQLNNPDDFRFVSELANNRSESGFWFSSGRGVRENNALDMRPSKQATGCSVFNKTKGTPSSADCLRRRPFICERVLPRIPKDVSIQHITSFTARVGWSAAASSSQPQAYHVELTTSSDNVVTRISSEKRSVTFTHLQPDTLYHVRVQAENRAGNGSSTSFVAFTTKARPPIIVPSAPNSKVIAGQSITLKCTHSRGDVLWYKQGSDEPFATGQELTLPEVSSNDEGTYYCASQNGPKGSIKVFVIVPPVITNLKCLLVEHDVILMCETANRHPVEYTWMKDGELLTSKSDKIKVPTRNNTGTGLYECHVSNIAGKASNSLDIASMGQRVDTNEAVYIAIIALLTALLAILCCAFGLMTKTGKIIFKTKKAIRKLTTPSSSTEMTPIEIVPSEESESRSPDNVTQQHDDVFPYLVSEAWVAGNGPYKSLHRGEGTEEHEQDVTQTWKPDYLNISPSNRNDSAANCMYAPLMYTQGGNDKSGRPYVNMDENGSVVKCVDR
ncbi:hemicentin-1-like [Montipora foliosa]|uniref:hemicentin-1-like n=1 Tax=Montipora foliosa TaxID=591990 RepID=UPI0035F11392